MRRPRSRWTSSCRRLRSASGSRRPRRRRRSPRTLRRHSPRTRRRRAHVSTPGPRARGPLDRRVRRRATIIPDRGHARGHVEQDPPPATLRGLADGDSRIKQKHEQENEGDGPSHREPAPGRHAEFNAQVDPECIGGQHPTERQEEQNADQRRPHGCAYAPPPCSAPSGDRSWPS